MTRAKKISTEAFDYELQTALSQIRVMVQVLTPRVFANYQKMMEEAKLKFENSTRIENDSPVKIPRKVFAFSTELKKQLNSAVTAKLNLYDQIGSKSHSISLKDYLYEFLDKEIKPVFPKGWMSLEVLKHKIKWIRQILPQEPKQSTPPSSQSQPTSQSSQSTVPPNQSSQIQSQTNRDQHLSNERHSKSQPIVTEKNNNSVEHKLIANPIVKTVSNSYQMSNKLNDNLSEGLVSKFMSTPKEVKESLNGNDILNLTSIDLSTKARSSPKPFNTSTGRLSPMNLKTSPNQSSVKSDSIKSSSPSVSPAVSSMLGTYNKTEKSEKLSHEACLTKVIEQSLGDYPNSSANITPSTQRISKTSSLPQTPLPFNEMFAKGFNSSANNSKPEICIEIASSPEPYNRVQQKSQQSSAPKQQTSISSSQQFSHQPKTSTPHSSQPKPSVSSTNSVSNMNFMRNSELPKKKYTSSGSISLIQSVNAQKEQELRSNVSKVDKSMHQMNATPNRSSSRDTSITITPIQNKSVENSVNSTKPNSSINSRHSITSTSSVSSTTPSYSFETPDPTHPSYMDMFHNYLRYTNNAVRFMDYGPLFQSPQSPQNLYYPYTTTTPSTTSNKSGGKDK